MVDKVLAESNTACTVIKCVLAVSHRFRTQHGAVDRERKKEGSLCRD